MAILYLQPIPHPCFRHQEARIKGIVAEFLAEVLHVDAEVMALLGGVFAPDFPEQLPVRHHLARVLRHHTEELVFRGGEVHFRAVHRHDAAGIVHFQPLHFKYRAFRLG